jgi:hypothetical protein
MNDVLTRYLQPGFPSSYNSQIIGHVRTISRCRYSQIVFYTIFYYFVCTGENARSLLIWLDAGHTMEIIA